VRLLTDGDRGEVTLRHDGRPIAVAVSTRALRRADRWSHLGTPGDVIDSAFGRVVVDVGAGPSTTGGLGSFFAGR
jgi:hypothetical protein